MVLTNAKETIVDDDMFEYLSQFKWHTNKHGYVKRNLTCLDGKSRCFSLHHVIIGRPLNGLQVDHINGDKLDNRKENLRIVTLRQNNQNRKEFRNQTKSSRFLGVFWDKNLGKWRAAITINRKMIHLGVFVNEETASLAYKKANLGLI